MAPFERRSGWSLAEQAGDDTPDAMQALLCSPCFDRDAVRDDVRAGVVAAIGDPGGVLIADETGFVKKGKIIGGGFEGPGSVLARRYITTGEMAY
jgi:SRSO17 transposase